MKKPWSISTTVRNPDRLRNFLNVLKQLEGQPFSSNNQIKYQILLIQNKLYKPGVLTKEQRTYFDNIEKEMSFEVAKKIFVAQNYIDPAMRGRNSVSPLNKIGLCIAKNSAKSVKITPLGEYFLSENYDLGELFFIHFLKWQLPNPASKSFLKNEGFNIKPFIGSLHLIREVNKLWSKAGNEPHGISKDEFSLFVPTLIDYSHIEMQAKKLIEYRNGIRMQKNYKDKKEFKSIFRKNFAKSFLGTDNTKEIKKLLKNLKDYGDNTIRYFRLTRLLHIRGGGFYVDLEPRRAIVLENLLATDNAAPLEFENADKYIEYLANLKQPILPWETKEELTKIALSLNEDIQNYIKELKLKVEKVPIFSFLNIKKLNLDKLKKYIEELRTYIRKLQELKIHFESQETSKIQEYIEKLKNIHKSENKKSIELEKLATLALNALNDALEIKPNYPVGDDNEPTFTAPANKADIECFYKTFNSVCEVTMLTNRSQWYNEGQPVMRHVREFENIHVEKSTYCLFIAPKLHQDTIETFWVAIKYGYRGATQRIIPLSIFQFIKLLESLLEIKKQNKQFFHNELLNLYEQVLDITDKVAHSEEWIENIPGIIASWQKSILKR